MATDTRPYVLRNVEDGKPVAVVDAISPQQAKAIIANKTWTASAVKSREAYDLGAAGVPFIDSSDNSDDDAQADLAAGS